jgi:YVTN family beta-propeller protein
MLSVLSIGVIFTVLIIAFLLGKALGESVIAVTPVGEFPHALEFNPSNNNIYVANIVSNSVSMIESMNNTVGGTVNVSSLPIALVFNPSNGGVYVGGTLTGTEGLVSVIG